MKRDFFLPIIVILTKEGSPQETPQSIVTNNQQPTTNNQQPTTNNQQPTTNNQQPTTNNQQPTTNNQQLFLGVSLRVGLSAISFIPLRFIKGYRLYPSRTWFQEK